jgi:glucose-1-phosphate adenylyltransferase
MMGADYYEKHNKKNANLGVGNGCIINNAILDKNVRIGNNVVMDYQGSEKNVDKGKYHIVDGIVIIPKGTIIPDNTKII